MDAPALRINCGSADPFTDPDGNVWQADRVAAAGQEGQAQPAWGRLGGSAVRRPEILPVHPPAWGGLLRSEAFDLKGYRCAVPPGAYRIGLIVIETFPSLESLRRTFAVTINGRIVVPALTPADIGGGFARAGKVTIRADVMGAEGLEIGFSAGAAVAGIEVVPDDSPGPMPATTAAWAPEAVQAPPRAEKARTFRVQVIGNSGSFFWAIPESTARLVAWHLADVRLETAAIYAYGRGVRFHLDSPLVAATLAAGGMDAVVIQDHSTGPLDKPEDFAESMPELIRRVRNAGASPVLYAYSGPQRNSPAERRKIQALYDAMGAEHGVPVIPFAAALALGIERNPLLDFHDDDAHHLGIVGGSLAVYTWYRALGGPGAPVLRNRAVLDGHAELPDELSQKMVAIADEVCAGREPGILEGIA
jgi:hypothetical protein